MFFEFSGLRGVQLVRVGVALPPFSPHMPLTSRG